MTDFPIVRPSVVVRVNCVFKLLLSSTE